MNTQLTHQQIEAYQQDGFILVEDFLDEEELAFWRMAVTEAIEERHGQKMPGSDIKVGEDDGINEDSEYYNKVFDQMLVEGGAGNDEEMLSGNALGVVVGNYSPEIKKLQNRDNVYFAEHTYAKGVLEGMDHYRFIQDSQ